MPERLPRLLAFAPLLCALFAAPGHAYNDIDRWDFTATNGNTGPEGTPITLTWSFAPDATLLPGNPSPTIPSNLISFLDTTFGAGPGGSDLTQRPWFPIFDQSFARMSALSGVTYVYKAQDDGHFFTELSSGAGNANRGDVRLGGKSYGSGSNVLASNFFPDFGGDMMINTDQGSFFSTASNNHRTFRNTLMHESMHGLGVSHVSASEPGVRFLIEPVLSTAFDGPQLDDVLAIQRLYGDIYEKNGGNDSFALATPLGALTNVQTLVKGTLGDSTIVNGAAVDFLSIDDDSDADFFSFTLSSALNVTLDLTPKGATYQIASQNSGGSFPPEAPLNSKSLSDLSLALFDNGGMPLGATANLNGAGPGGIHPSAAQSRELLCQSHRRAKRHPALPTNDRR